MQTQSQEFRAQATECQELADHSREFMKEQYEQLVRQWLFLAEQAKSREELPQRVAAWKRVHYSETDRRYSPFAQRHGPISREGQASAHIRSTRNIRSGHVG